MHEMGGMKGYTPRIVFRISCDRLQTLNTLEQKTSLSIFIKEQEIWYDLQFISFNGVNWYLSSWTPLIKRLSFLGRGVNYWSINSPLIGKVIGDKSHKNGSIFQKQ